VKKNSFETDLIRREIRIVYQLRTRLNSREYLGHTLRTWHDPPVGG